MRRYQVPSWLEPLLPHVVAPTLIDSVDDADGEEYWGIAPDGQRRLLGTALDEAFDAVDGDAVFSQSLTERFGHSERLHIVPASGSKPSAGRRRLKGPDGSAWLLAHSDAYRVARLADAWTEFLEQDAAWRANPTFLNAWRWIDMHPTFWIRTHAAEPGDLLWKDAYLWDWETDGHMSRVHVGPGRYGGDHVLIKLETGDHVSEDRRHADDTHAAVVVEDLYRTHHWDPRLDTFAPTYEEAVQLLALAIDAVFDAEGNERPGAPSVQDALPPDVAQALREGESRPDTWADVPRVKFADLGHHGDGLAPQPT